MKTLGKLVAKQDFDPDFLLGIWINPFFVTRWHLRRAVRRVASRFRGGRLLDVGCGSKPYADLFEVASYVGLDIEQSGHDHATSQVDVFYDGQTFPFADGSFDRVVSFEVLEHVFNPDRFLSEIRRVLKDDGALALTCPFAWEEHEAPFDFARYTSFGLRALLERHGFVVERLDKTAPFIPSLAQLLAAYVSFHVLGRIPYARQVLGPVIVAPINLIGMACGAVLPRNYNLYLNAVVVARKAAMPPAGRDEASAP